MPGMLCRIKAFGDRIATVDADLHGVNLPTEFPADVLRKLKLKRGDQFVWNPPDDVGEEVKPEHILLKWTDSDLLYKPGEALERTKKAAADHKRAKQQRRYMVILQWGRHEDTEMTSVVMSVEAPAGGEPRTILQKLVEDYTTGYKVIRQDDLVCPNEDCRMHNRAIDGNFCSACGSEGTHDLPPCSDYISDSLHETLFDGSASEVPQEIIDAMEEGGWELWPREYDPDVIVYASGVRDFLEDPKSWYDEFGKLEVLRA